METRYLRSSKDVEQWQFEGITSITSLSVRHITPNNSDTCMSIRVG